MSDISKLFEWGAKRGFISLGSFQAVLLKPGQWLIDRGINFGPLTSVVIRISGISKLLTITKIGCGFYIHLRDYLNGENKRQNMWRIANDVLSVALMIFAAVMPLWIAGTLTIISACYAFAGHARHSTLKKKRVLEDECRAERVRLKKDREDHVSIETRRSITPAPSSSPPASLANYSLRAGQVMTRHDSCVFDPSLLVPQQPQRKRSISIGCAKDLRQNHTNLRVTIPEFQEFSDEKSTLSSDEGFLPSPRLTLLELDAKIDLVDQSFDEVLALRKDRKRITDDSKALNQRKKEIRALNIKLKALNIEKYTREIDQDFDRRKAALRQLEKQLKEKENEWNLKYFNALKLFEEGTPWPEDPENYPYAAKFLALMEKEEQLRQVRKQLKYNDRSWMPGFV